MAQNGNIFMNELTTYLPLFLIVYYINNKVVQKMKKIINIAYTFVGNMVEAFIKWLLLILIVRFTNPEMVGYYTFAIALTSPVMLLLI